MRYYGSLGGISWTSDTNLIHLKQADGDWQGRNAGTVPDEIAFSCNKPESGLIWNQNEKQKKSIIKIPFPDLEIYGAQIWQIWNPK